MAQIMYDESKLDVNVAAVVIYAVQAYGHVAHVDLRKEVTLGEFADLIEKVYDASEPRNKAVIDALRKNDQRKPLVLENARIVFRVEEVVGAVCLTAYLEYSKNGKEREMLFSICEHSVTCENETEEFAKTVRADAEEQGIPVRDYDIEGMIEFFRTQR